MKWLPFAGVGLLALGFVGSTLYLFDASQTQSSVSTVDGDDVVPAGPSLPDAAITSTQEADLTVVTGSPSPDAPVLLLQTEHGRRAAMRNGSNVQSHVKSSSILNGGKGVLVVWVPTNEGALHTLDVSLASSDDKVVQTTRSRHSVVHDKEKGNWLEFQLSGVAIGEARITVQYTGKDIGGDTVFSFSEDLAVQVVDQALTGPNAIDLPAGTSRPFSLALSVPVTGSAQSVTVKAVPTGIVSVGTSEEVPTGASGFPVTVHGLKKGQCVVTVTVDGQHSHDIVVKVSR